MKKFIISAAVIAAISAGAFTAFNSLNNTRELSALELANIEALTTTEHPNYTELCNTHCWNKTGYICYLILNTGATVYCDEMVHWTYFPQ